MAEAVLDASAVLAVLHGEPGDEVVKAIRRRSVISAANFAEVITKLIEEGMPPGEAEQAALWFGSEVVEVDRERAIMAGQMHVATRKTGVSLADRFCLALGRELRLPVLTTDRRWATLGLDVEVRLIR